jgi:nucleotide-binding universal stress UspA family protein
MPTYTTEGTLTGGGLAPLRRSVDEAVATLEAARLRVTTCIEPGLPSRMLIEEAHRWPAEVIFVGSRGLGPVARVLLGGVSLAVAEHAECSVEVIRPREIRPSGRLSYHLPTEVPHEVQAG